MGALAPHFCQHGAGDYAKVDEKIGGGGGSSKASERYRAWPKIIFIAHFLARATPLFAPVKFFSGSVLAFPSHFPDISMLFN